MKKMPSEWNDKLDVINENYDDIKLMNSLLDEDIKVVKQIAYVVRDPDILEKLSKHNHPSVRAIVAWNKYTPQECYEHLSKDTIGMIRMNLAMNKNVHSSILSRMKKVEENPNILDRIIDNLNSCLE